MQAPSVYQEALVQRMEEQGALSARVREAFLTVPRHAFLAPEDGNRSAIWLEEVYQDRALLTRRDRRGMPLSSSSQPSAMALMLEALDVQPGMRVLEIGTGTGYNAALLARLAGDPALVTTVEIDRELADLARGRIESVVGTGMTVIVGDGHLGAPGREPYERIIATASAFPVPHTWVEQLASGGRLVLDLRGKIGGGLMVVEKQEDGSAQGHFLAVKEEISFMRMRDTAEGNTQVESFAVPTREKQTVYEAGTTAYACAEHFCSFERFRERQEEALNLWMQCHFPALAIKWYQREQRAWALLIDEQTGTTVAIEQREDGIGIVVKGERALWEEMTQAYEQWLALGQPGKTCSTLMISAKTQEMVIRQGDLSSSCVISR